MSLTDIQKLKLEVGLLAEASDLLSDEELTYFLHKNNNSIRKAGLDAAKTVLFILSQLIHERSGSELEVWGHTWFENYMKTLQMYLNDPNYSIALESAKAYAGGISIADIRKNIDTPDNLVVNVDIAIPKEGIASTSTNTFKDIFDVDNNCYSTLPFTL